MKELQNIAPDNRKGFVFPLYTGNNETSYGNLIQHFTRLRKKWKLDEYERLGKQKTYTYPYPPFVFLDNQGVIHSYDTMKDAANEYFKVSAKTLQRSLKKKIGNAFIINGEDYTLLA